MSFANYDGSVSLLPWELRSAAAWRPLSVDQAQRFSQEPSVCAVAWLDGEAVTLSRGGGETWATKWCTSSSEGELVRSRTFHVEPTVAARLLAGPDCPAQSGSKPSRRPVPFWHLLLTGAAGLVFVGFIVMMFQQPGAPQQNPEVSGALAQLVSVLSLWVIVLVGGLASLVCAMWLLRRPY